MEQRLYQRPANGRDPGFGHVTPAAADGEGRRSGDVRRPDGARAAADPARLPAKPTAAMLANGARAGGVSVETAWRVYQAMLRGAG